MIGGIENTTAPETAKLCAQYLGPALRLLNFNTLPPPPLSPFLAPVVTPDKIVYSDPALAPGGAGPPPGPPEQLPAVSAYAGAQSPSPDAPPAPLSLPDLLLPAEAPPPTADPPVPPPAEGTPPS